MDFRSILFDSSRQVAINAYNLIGDDSNKIKLLFDFIMEKVPRYSPRAVRVFYMLDLKFPHLTLTYIPKIITHLPVFDTGTQRGFIKILGNHVNDLREEEFGFLLDFCINVVNNSKAEPAQIIYSMDVLYQMVLKEPLLKDEVVETIRAILPYGSKAVKYSGNKILQQLNN